MKIALSRSLHEQHPRYPLVTTDLVPQDVSIIVKADWEDIFESKFSRLRYVLVQTVDEGAELLKGIESATTSPRRVQSRERSLGL